MDSEVMKTLIVMQNLSNLVAFVMFSVLVKFARQRYVAHVVTDYRFTSFFVPTYVSIPSICFTS